MRKRATREEMLSCLEEIVAEVEANRSEYPDTAGEEWAQGILAAERRHTELERAIKALKPYARRKLRNVYDDEQFPSEALTVILPEFEYPEWDYHPVSEIIKEGQHQLDYGCFR